MTTKVPPLSGGQKAVFYGGVTVMALFFVAPVVAIALGVVVNIAMIAVVGTTLLAAWIARPWIVLKWKNFVLKALKAEARANPIETLQNEFLNRKAIFEEANKRLTTLVAMRDTLGTHPAWQRINPSREMKWSNLFISPKAAVVAPATAADGG